MIKLSVLYPNTGDCRFDWDYYGARHIPLIESLLGAACKRIEVEQGLSGAAPGSKPPYVAAAHLYFDSLETYQEAIAPHADAIRADVVNYTNVEPLLQVSELR